MQEWLRLAFSATVRNRAIKVALVVGTILLAINHGDAILSGNIPPVRLLRMILTVFVPYAVSTVSSVGAMLDLKRDMLKKKPSDILEEP